MPAGSSMISEDLFSFEFIKKSAFHGSSRGLRYRIGKSGEALEVCTWPEPYSYEYTPKEKKTVRCFSFDPEGYEEAKAYLDGLDGMDKDGAVNSNDSGNYSVSPKHLLLRA